MQEYSSIPELVRRPSKASSSNITGRTRHRVAAVLLLLMATTLLILMFLSGSMPPKAMNTSMSGAGHIIAAISEPLKIPDSAPPAQIEQIYANYFISPMSAQKRRARIHGDKRANKPVYITAFKGKLTDILSHRRYRGHGIRAGNGGC